MSKIFVGIDVSKKDLAITIIDNDKTHYRNVTNNQAGFKEFSQWLNSYKVSKVRACMESTGIYSLAFADYLHEQGHEVSIVNPACINAFAKSKLSRHKNDKVDSKVIAEYASKFELKPYIPRDPAALELRSLYNCIQNLGEAHRKVQNYLEATERMSSAVIKTYQDISASLLNEIAKLEEKIDDLLGNNPEVKQAIDNMQTIPGIGKKTAIAVMSLVPNMNIFEDARQLAAFVGLTPKEYQSGSSIKKRGRISKIGSHQLRKALYFPAMSAMQYSPMMKDFAEKLRAKGKCGKVIIVAIMRKLLHTIFGVIKHKTVFNINWNCNI